jgi:hypothetical protein
MDGQGWTCTIDGMTPLAKVAYDAWVDTPFDDVQPYNNWRKWEAAAVAVRAEVIEECAKLCDQHADPDTGQEGMRTKLGYQCAEAIRALKDQP